MVSTNTSCFEGCRIYRNAMLQHVRTALQAKYPGTWLEQVSSTFGKEWEGLKKAAELRRKTNELSGTLVDELDILDVNHFHNLFERYFDDLFPLDDRIEVRQQTRQSILRWGATVKNLRDPVIGHPSESDVSREDAFVMLDSARRILELIDSTAAEQLRSLCAPFISGSPVIEDPRKLEASTLPSRESIAPTFIGRRTELEGLHQWIQKPHSPVWLLAGDGGKGKTAIAYEFARTIAQEPPPDLDLEIVIWLSAKARRFASGIAHDIENPDFWNLESALDWVLRAYGALGIESMDTATKEEECRNYLSQLPSLVILDDVDSLEELDAIHFFMHRTQTTSKILLTSRMVLFGLDPAVTQVNGFESGSEDGVKFVESQIRLSGLDRSGFRDSDIESIVKVCDGSPLYIQDLLRLCIVGEAPKDAVKIWAGRDGEAARRYALNESLRSCRSQPRRCSWPCVVSRRCRIL